MVARRPVKAGLAPRNVRFALKWLLGQKRRLDPLPTTFGLLNRVGQEAAANLRIG
jgi:hypothetical protein